MFIHQARHFVRRHDEGDNTFDGYVAYDEPAIGRTTGYLWHASYRAWQTIDLEIQAHKIGRDAHLGMLHGVRRRGIEDDQVVYGVLLHVHHSRGQLGCRWRQLVHGGGQSLVNLRLGKRVQERAQGKNPASSNHQDQ